MELPTEDNVPKVYAIANGSYEIVDVANIDDTVKNNIKTNVKILVTENKIEITKQTVQVGSSFSDRFDSRYSGSTLSTFFQNTQPITSITIKKIGN